MPLIEPRPPRSGSADDSPILIVGASARAAAESARRGGLRPWAADLFCDEDLRACCPAVRIENYPQGAAEALSCAPSGPWMYTGALENHPALLDQLAAIRPLYGIGGESLRAVRNPLQLADAIRAAGYPAPRCTLSPDGLPGDGSWLSKPLASSSGAGIVGHAVRANATLPTSNRYYQERIDGLPASAVYLGTNSAARCLGVTRQLLGLPWCGTGRREIDHYRYCGSIGPVRLESPLAARFSQLGDAIARAFSLVGLFGIDVILRDNEIWPIEINPRYTASTELLERAYDFSAVRLHVEACKAWEERKRVHFEQEETEETEISHSGLVSPFPLFPSVHSPVFGKAILFALADVIVGEEFSDWICRVNSGCASPAVADIPSIGTEIHAGHPIVTVFAAEPDGEGVLKALETGAAEVYEKLAVSTPAANNFGDRLS